VPWDLQVERRVTGVFTLIGQEAAPLVLMLLKLLYSIVMILVGLCWYVIAGFLGAIGSAGAGVGPVYSEFKILMVYVWLFLPVLTSLAAALAPYDWFPESSLPFLKWPWSIVSFLASIGLAYLCIKI
jgi:hypothetical protein